MRLLILNSGSSSLKVRLLDILEGVPQETAKPPRALLTGSIKGIGGTATLEIVDAVHLPPGSATRISQEADVAAYVVADDEETWIAPETVRCVRLEDAV